MIDWNSSAQEYALVAQRLAPSALIGGTAHLPAAMWAEAPKRVLRRRAHAAALSSVPRIAHRAHTR